MVEYSPAKEQVDIVVSAPEVLMVAVPNEDENVQPPTGGAQFRHCTVVVWHEKSVPHDELSAQ